MEERAAAVRQLRPQLPLPQLPLPVAKVAKVAAGRHCLLLLLLLPRRVAGLRLLLATKTAAAHLVDLHKADAHGKVNVCRRLGHSAKNSLHHGWDDSLAVCATGTEGATHCVRLAAAGLAVGKHCGIVALEQAVHEGRHAAAVQRRRGLRPKGVAKDMVVAEQVGAMPYLRNREWQ